MKGLLKSTLIITLAISFSTFGKNKRSPSDSETSCELRIFKDSRETDLKTFESLPFSYAYSKQKIIEVKKVTIPNKKDRYEILYKSIPDIKKAKEYQGYLMSCDDSLGCHAKKISEFSYYQNKKDLPIEASGYGTSLFQGGRAMFFFKRNTNYFNYRFTDIVDEEKGWSGVEVTCFH